MKKCLVAGVLLLVSMILFQCYYVRQGVALFDIYAGAEPIERSLSRDDLAPAERAALDLVLEIKRFATEKLGLAQNSNYSTYIRINRDYLVDVVSACDRLSFNQYQWDYLFVGKLPYKGFFSRAEADREAEMLSFAGYDVLVRHVDAFSTLGFLSDPVFSFMTDYPVYALAELVIHEQSHATVFLQGQATFNEKFAQFVGYQGMRDFLAATYGADSRESRLVSALDQDQLVFFRKIDELFRDLERVYTGQGTDAAKLEGKASAITDWKTRYTESYQHDFRTDAYRSFSQREINNALIMTYRNYIEKQDDLAALFDLCGRDLPGFIGFAKKLKADEIRPLEKLNALIRESF